MEYGGNRRVHSSTIQGGYVSIGTLVNGRYPWGWGRGEG